ncbi:MAG: hypothetical protein E3J64_05725, partial [Anaerolineales bacterium]
MRERTARHRGRLLWLAAAVLLIGTTLAMAGGGDTTIAPLAVPGEAIYIPFPVEIVLDGQLSDWDEVPAVRVTKGPMQSPDPSENGSFTFAVAADMENLYITMSMPDQNIIAGQHGVEFWNEDSFEFFVNASGDLNASSYGAGIFQINVNAVDIGNTDPDALTITGVNSANAAVRGFVFETDDGWGIEVAVLLDGLLEPEHGREIGFQAQINGATEADRNVKLIWSSADTSDSSWSNPRVFGRALFFEIGRTDIPQPSGRIVPTATPVPTPTPIPPPMKLVHVNQTGYLCGAPKRAVAVDASGSPLEWELLDGAGAVVLSGSTIVYGDDDASGDHVHVADFSDRTAEGTGYTLRVGDEVSHPFDIGPDIYHQLKYDALAYFYHNRSGVEIEMPYAGDEQWTRPAGHIGVSPNLGDTDVTCYAGASAGGQQISGCDYSLDVSGGWYDAGDHGKYVVNGGISVWTLMNQYERGLHLGSSVDDFGDGRMNIPENDNGEPDILDEARWEMEFLLSMQIPEATGEPTAGMVHHKVHDTEWTGLPLLAHEDPQQRYLYPPSTAATLNLAATAAQCARIWESIDPDFSQQCLSAAELAWGAALANPEEYAQDFDGGGTYGDDVLSDEFYWAAAELYVTTGEAEYRDYVRASHHRTGLRVDGGSSMYWGDTAALGTISLAVVPNELDEDELDEARASIVSTADIYVATLDEEGYLVPFALADGYPWGSNSSVLNNLIVVALAHDFTGDEVYLHAVSEGMDYILGRNP